MLRYLLSRIRGYDTLTGLIKVGLKVGENFYMQPGCIIDPSHCWLISIGNNVTFARNVYILAHDASTKIPLGYTKIGKVEIGNNVFIGANSMIMPGVKIGDNVIIGAGSVVVNSIASNSVAVGVPARIISTYDEFVMKNKNLLNSSHTFNVKYTLNGKITDELKKEMNIILKDGIGFIE